MTGCCDNNKGCCDSNSKREEREIPDGLEPCCSVSGRRCLCLPYDDPYLISAQILTIASVFFGWICWVTFFISFVGLTMFQVLWCARMRSGILYGQVAIAGLTSVGHLIVAIYVLVAWRRKRWCEPWGMYSNDYYYDDDFQNNDNCMEKTWFAIGLVCALMWAAASVCMFLFVKSGRHAKWEAEYLPSKGDVEITNQEDPVVADAAIVGETEKEDTV